MKVGSTSLASIARTADAMTRNTPAMLPNRFMTIQENERPTSSIQWQEGGNQETRARKITRRPPLETAQQQSRTRRGFLQEEASLEMDEDEIKEIVTITYSGAISLREEREDSRTTGESSASEETSTCTASEEKRTKWEENM